MVLNSDKEMRFFVVNEYTNDAGDQTEFVDQDLTAKKLSLTIPAKKDITQKIKLVCFRKDSPDRILSAGRSLQSADTTTLTVSYVAPGEGSGSGPDSESVGLTTGALIGIVAGILVLIGLLVLVCCCCCKKKKKPGKAEAKEEKKTSINLTITNQTIRNPYIGPPRYSLLFWQTLFS